MSQCRPSQRSSDLGMEYQNDVGNQTLRVHAIGIAAEDWIERLSHVNHLLSALSNLDMLEL